MQAPDPSRRGFVRVPVTQPFHVEVGPPIASSNQPLRCEGSDLSVYGLAFMLADPQAHRPFSTGTVLERLSFEIEGRKIVVDAKVQHYADGKVGVEFMNIAAEDVWFLSAYIVKAANLKHPPVAKHAKKKKAKVKPKAKAKPKKKAPARKAKAKGKAKAKAKTKAKPKKTKPSSKKKPVRKKRR